MPDINDVVRALRAAIDAPSVTVEEDWRRGRQVVQFLWDGEQPEPLRKLRDLLEEVANAVDVDDVCMPARGRLGVARGPLLQMLRLDDRVETLFLTEAGLRDAVEAEGLLRETALVEALEAAGREGKCIALLWQEPPFRIGRTIVCPLDQGVERSDLPLPMPLPDAMTPEAIMRLVTVQSPAPCPRPDVLLPVQAPEGQGGPAFKLFQSMAAAHAVATLARELPSPGRVLLAGARARPARLDLKDMDAKQFPALERTVLWVFQHDQALTERHQVASRELSERLGTIFTEDASVLAAAVEKAEHLDKAVEHAYRVYVEKQLDNFFDSQKSLIGEVKSLTSAFAEKARTLVSALARDALAGTIATALVSLRILGTSDKTPEVPDIVFHVIASLLVLAGALQLASAAVDLHLSLREFDAWIRRMDFLLPKDEREALVEGPRNRRLKAVMWTTGIVAACYLLLGIGIANFKAIIS